MSGVKHTYDPDEVEAVSRKITRERVLQKSLEWNNHCAAGLINQEELRLINLYDKKSIDQKINIFRENPTGIVQLFVTLIGGKSVNANLERSRYGLALIDELLEAEPSLYKNFIVIDDLWTPFMRLMQTKEDPFCAATAVKLVALFILRSNQLPDGVVDDVLRWCNERLRNQSDLEIALEGLQMLLRQNDIRLRFFEEDGLNRLGSIIKSSTNTIIVYKALYCVWVMSYNKQIASKFHTTTLIAHVVEAMRTIQKEKIIRMAIAILVNIADRGDSFQQTYTQNNQQMIEAKIHRVLDSLNQKKWADDDLNNDLETLTDIINKNISEMSSWDSYKTELMSGVLEWSPVHTSERFWRENVNKFDEENYEALRTLIALLRQSSNAQNLQIGCHDIGEYVRFHPIGRQIVNKLDGKAVIMRHMEHPDAAVQKEALLCTQKLLVVSWDHLPR